jgi:hypothetical protein
MGNDFACAISDGGAISCWGNNASGQSNGVFPGYPRILVGFP